MLSGSVYNAAFCSALVVEVQLCLMKNSVSPRKILWRSRHARLNAVPHTGRLVCCALRVRPVTPHQLCLAHSLYRNRPIYLGRERCKDDSLQVPEGVDPMKVITNAMDKYKVEIAGGLGPSAGKVWRVGILGYNAQPQNIQLVLDVFREGLQQQGYL